MAIFRNSLITICAMPLAIVCLPSVAEGQVDFSRRETTTPGLMLDTGSRTGACDVLTFTNNGQYLLAAGDDKVVRTWSFTAKGLEPIADPAPDGIPQPVLRWSNLRERRGNIYAAAVSPDPKGKYIAFGGTGIRTSQFVVLDRFTGETKQAVPTLSGNQSGGFSIWSVAFSPNGDQVACGTDGGTVWVWDWKKGTQPILLGQHAPKKGDDGTNRTFNYVRFLNYEANQLVSADEQGGVYRWNLNGENKTETAKAFTFSNHGQGGTLIRTFAMSPDGQWLAAALESRKVEIRALASGAVKSSITLDPGNFPNAVAFDPKGQRLAVSIRVVDQQASFLKEIGHKISVYDVGKAEPGVTQQIAPSYRIECLAFHPDGDYLAAAGGNNHDVNVYDLSNPKRGVGTPIAGPGECIWGVSLSKDGDGRYLGFQTQRSLNPDHPNHQGAGPKKVFDLRNRVFVADPGITWTTLADETVDGWKVVFSTDKVKRADQWFVQGPGTDLLAIPWDVKEYEFPRCYTFLRKTETHPTRLIIGHMWGASIYELEGKGIRPSRLLIGHDGLVSSLALSADGSRMVTASRDQTIAGWSLEDWPSHPQLGAKLYIKDGKLLVGQVDTGGPLWETGLSTDDEIELLVIGGKEIIYHCGTKTGSPEAALRALKNPKVGVEHYFAWKRPDTTGVMEGLTTLRERPIWRFFPTKDKEWVLWRYQDFLYDTSTRGASYIGWQRIAVNEKGRPDVAVSPQFYRAEQFRNSYHQPEKVTQTLLNWTRTGQDKSSFVEIEPPRIQLKADGIASNNKIEVQDKGFKLSIKVVPNSDRQNQELSRVILWINDYQFKKWENAEFRKHITLQKNNLGLARGVFEIDGIMIPPEVLRSGSNVVFVQCYNKADVRGESDRVLVMNRKSPPPGTLHGLFIGVGDYSKSVPRQVPIHGDDDAEVLAELWEKYRGKSYAKANIRILLNEKANFRLVQEELKKLADTAKPDDLLVFYLGGHGVSTQKMVSEVRQRMKLPDKELRDFEQQLPTLSPFLFLCGDFHMMKVRDTTVSLDDVYEKLVKLPCHKVILLDACHSGAADPTERKGTDMIRLFTKDGVGPIMFAACKAEESSWERPTFVVEPAYGLFAQAIVKAVREDFGASKKERLDAPDLISNVRINIDTWVKTLHLNPALKDVRQNPQIYLPRLERDFAILTR